MQGAKQRALLLRLLVDPGRPIAADQLVEDLWEGTPPGSARATLQSHVSHLRRVVGDRLRTVPGGYAFDVAEDELDAALFDAEASQARRLTDQDPGAAAAVAGAALRRWRGRALADLDSVWATAEAARLEELRLATIECELEARLALGHHAHVIAQATHGLTEHALRERLWALLITALYRDGRQSDALRAYDRLRRRLADELGIDPSPELRALERSVLAQEPVPTAPVGYRAAPSNLPTMLASLIGRDDDVRALAEEARAQRLVTLTGVGGVGKTRLAVAVAQQLAPELSDGAWLVELATVSEHRDVATAIATAIGAPRLPGLDPSASLLAHLADRRLLLVLDNCEHVLDPVADLARTITASAPDVRILATSREALDLPGEVARRVRSLEVPDADVAAADAAQVPSVRLFTERAAAADGDFVLDHTNVDDVAAICRRLDGVPLAIELAAARVRTMTPAEIAARLDDRFRVLTGARRAHERHRTMLATVAWSYELLTAKEQQVFAQLSVFPSTFALDSVRAVVQLEAVEAEDVVDLLLRLVDRSLVVHEQATGRYHLLETLRQFAADRLAEAGLVDATLERYVDHFMRLVIELAPGVDDHRHDVAVARLASELENIRSAAELLSRAARWPELGAMAVAGWRFFTQFTPLESGEWLAATLASNGFADPATEADALAAMAMMAANVAAVDESRAYAHRSLQLAARHSLTEPPWARFALAMVGAITEDPDACLDNATAAARAGEARGDELVRIVAAAESSLPLVRQNRMAEADAAVREAVEGALRLRNTTALSVALICSSSAYMSGGDEPELDRMCTLFDRYADRAVGPYGGLNMAYLLTFRAVAESGRDPRRAIRLAVEAARIADRSSPFALTCAATALSLACARAGHLVQARRLLNYAEPRGAAGFDSSPTGWLRRDVVEATAEVQDAEAAAPAGRRELIVLISEVASYVVDGAEISPNG